MSASAVLANPALAVAPGGTITCDLKVRNTGTAADSFSIRLVDGPHWARCIPSTLMIEAGGEATTRIVCQPPRDATTVPGRSTLSVAIAGRADKGPATLVALPVDIESFADLVTEIQPRRASGRREAQYRLTVRNRGNCELPATIRATSADDLVELTALPPDVVVPAGGSAESVLTARVGRLFGLGKLRERGFAVVVEAPDAPPARIEGVLAQRPVVSARRAWVGGGVAAVAAAALVVAGLGPSSSPKKLPALPAGSAAAAPPATPLCVGAAHLAHSANGLVRTAVVEPTNYSFLFLDHDCSPVRFDPCQPIHVLVDSSLATPANLADLNKAMAIVDQATGLNLMVDGVTADRAEFSRLRQAARDQHRWSPVGIDWRHLGPGTDQTEVLGEGRPDVVGPVIVTGGITFNADAHQANGAPLPDGFGAEVTWGRVILHELGHVVGLGHVSNPDEVMHEPLSDQVNQPSLPNSAFGVGDVTGLRLLGRSAGCLAIPPVQPLPREIPTRQ